jgi:hypothetical protein
MQTSVSEYEGLWDFTAAARPRGLPLLALVLSLSAFGCSGDGSDGGGSSAGGANRALDNQDCYMGLQIPGVQHEGYACSGTSTSSTISGLKPNVLEAALRVSFTLGAEPEIGSLDIAELEVGIPSEEGDNVWLDDGSNCMADAVGESFDADFMWTYFRIDVSCAAPMEPADDNPEGPLDVGDFTIVTFFSD